MGGGHDFGAGVDRFGERHMADLEHAADGNTGRLDIEEGIDRVTGYHTAQGSDGMGSAGNVAGEAL